MKKSHLSKILLTVVEQMADNVLITDKEGIIEYVNKAFERTTGFNQTEALGQTPSILKSGQHDDAYYKKLWRTILKGQVFKSTISNKKKNGDIYYADQAINPLFDDAGDIVHFVSVFKDVSDRITYEAQLIHLNETLEFERKKFEELALLDERINTIQELDQLINYVLCTTSYILKSERCSFMLLDPKSNTLSIKGAIGLDNEAILNKQVNLGEGIAGLVAKKQKSLLVKMVDTDKRIKRGNLSHYKTKSFLSVPIHFEDKLIGVINVTDKTGEDSGVYTELDLKILLSIVRRTAVAINNVHMVKELTHLTITDAKTGLFNDRYLLTALNFEIERIKRTERPLSLMMIDVDNFKFFNDKYGHLAGDEILKQLGLILKNNLREIDICCRYAGDEFIVILPETDQLQARVAANKVLDKINKMKSRKKVTCSIGVALYMGKQDAKHFIENVDSALYSAKDSGKNTVFVYDKEG